MDLCAARRSDRFQHVERTAHDFGTDTLARQNADVH
jgi:hypothetical protein